MNIDIVVNAESFSTENEVSAFQAVLSQEVGAVVTFSGCTRAEEGRTEHLILQHYEGFTEKEIMRIAERVQERFGLDAIQVRHRVGNILPGEMIVFVAAAASHRRAAFEACEMMMDYLKSAAPFWKQEAGPAGARWIEPTADDIVARKRWDKDDAWDQ